MQRSANLALLVVLGTAGATAAPTPDGPDKVIQRIAPPQAFDRLGYAEGLPNSNVRAIVQDPIGFVWFGTQDGLARYDGNKMRVYKHSPADPGSISGSYITALALDASGKLWVGTAENGVNLYDPATDQFQRFGTGQGLSSAGVSAIVRDHKNRMWFAMTGGGLNRYGDDGKFVAYRTAPLDTNITAVDSDPAGNLWLGTEAGLLRWSPESNTATTFPIAEATPVTAVAVAADGTIWVGTEGDGLAVVEPTTRKTTRYRHADDDPGTISDNRITEIFEDRANQIWIGTANGLSQFTGKGFVQYQHDPNDPTSLAFPGVESLFQDAGGVMWVGGFTVGACKFDQLRSRFGRYRTRTHPANSYFEEADGSLWVGTYHGGLYKYDWAQQRVTLYHRLRNGDEVLPLESAWISAVHRDSAGTLWLSLVGTGLVGFDTRTETFKKLVPDPEAQDALPADTIWDIWEDPRGGLVLATWGAGLVRFDPKAGTFATLAEEPTHIYTLYPDPNAANTLWLGAAKGGLVRFDLEARKGKAFRHRADDSESLSSDDVLSVLGGGDGTMWVGTYGGGLNRLDLATGKVKRYSSSNSGLPNDVIYGVLADDQGHVWASTNGGGLVRFDPKAERFLVYDAADGLQSSEFAQGSFLRTKRGKLVFGGVNGFNLFDPKAIQRDAYVAPIVLTSLKVFNHELSLERPIWTLPSLTLSHSDSFELQFAALAFAAPHKNRYAYKLEGFDEDFIETDRPYATYTKLDGGSYTLRVRAANRHGVWNEEGIAFAISVTPPFWRTWPAYALYVALLAGAILLTFYINRQRVRRAEREGRLAVVERDLELTGAVQSGFLPSYNEIEQGRVRILGFYRAADACSGDWWWHEQVAGRHVVLVGDVTGHGPGPAMVTAAVATAFKVLKVNGVRDLRTALETLNSVVLDVAKGKYHMTMAALELDEHSGTWVLHSAGAPPIMTLGSSGKHRVHFSAGTPLGIEAAFEPGRVEGRLEPDERILVCTDGIPEILLPNGSALGMRRLAQVYERTREVPLREAAAAIVAHADVVKDGKPQEDDWTFALIEWGDRVA